MEAPKYVLYVDHLAHANNVDKYVETHATKFIDAYNEATDIIDTELAVYLVRVYEIVKRTHGTKYTRIANVRGGLVCETIADGDSITRHVENEGVWYE